MEQHNKKWSCDMAKNNTKSQKLPAFGEDTGYVAKMKAAAIKHADNNIIFELALKHLYCDNPSPTAVEDAGREFRARVKSQLVQAGLKKREV